MSSSAGDACGPGRGAPGALGNNPVPPSPMQAQSNAVDGPLLATLTDDDLATQLNMKPLQIRKVPA